MNPSTEKLYHWYLLGCRWMEEIPMSREEFAEQAAVESLLGGSLPSQVFERTLAEIALDSEDARWTEVLQRLRNLNFAPEQSDLVAAIQKGRELDDGEAGSAGVRVPRVPWFPFLSGAGARPLPEAYEELLCVAR